MRQAATTAEAEAVAAAASLGTNTGAFLDQAWAAVGDLKKVSALYQQVATANPAVALVLARFERMMGGRGDESGMALRGLLEEDGVVLTAPLLVANLAGGARMQAAARLVMLGDARGVPRMREALADAPERSWQAALWAGIAHWGSDADRAEARAQQRGEFDYLTAELARQGDEAAGAALGRALDGFVDRWDAGERMSSSDYEPVRLLLGMIHDARPAAAIPALVRACVSPLVVGALAALAAQGPAGAAAAAPSARALLADVRGPEDDRMWAYRLAAQVALSAAGEAPTELDTARAALTRAHLRRYGYPKVDDLRQIHLLAARLLLDHGDEVDRTEVARLATADHQQLRQLGLAAYDRLGRPRPTLRYCDPARVAWEQAQHGSARLRELLADPGAVWPHFVAKALAASDDEAGRAAALDWAFAVVGAARPYPISYLEASDLGEEVAAAVGVVKQLVAGDEAGLARVRALAHPWLDQAVLGSKPAPRAAEALGQADAIGAVVRRIDRVPFVLGKHINGLALDADGRRLAVVGDGLGVIVDAVTGAVVTELALRYSWGYDAAWAPPGAGADALVVAYHGGHLVEFDPATGVARRELPGFGGVPNGVRCCAFSADGSRLAAGGSCGNAVIYRWPSGEVLWQGRGEGGFQTVRWSADGTRCTFSHVKTGGGTRNYLQVVELATGASQEIAMPSSMWALGPDRGDGAAIWAGGEAKKLVALDATGAPGKKTAAVGRVVRLVATGGGAVLAATEAGQLVRVGPGGEVTALGAGAATGQSAIEDEIHGMVAEVRGEPAPAPPAPPLEGPLWALAVAGDGRVFAAGTSGTVYRFDSAGRSVAGVTGQVHTGQVRGFVPLADGTVISGGWDGRVLAWSPGEPAARLITKFGRRVEELVASADGRHAWVGGDHAVWRVDAAAATVHLALPGEDVEALAVDDHGDVVCATNRDRVVRIGEGGAPVWSVAVADPSALVVRADGVIVVGTEAGRLVGLDPADGRERWNRHEHGRDLIDTGPYGNPHCTVVGLARAGDTWWSGCNDDTLRWMAGTTEVRRVRRFLVDLGLFNGVVASPDGALVAATGSGYLHLFDARRGEHLRSLPRTEFPGADSLTRLAFVDADRLWVGSERGAMFEVTLEVP